MARLVTVKLAESMGNRAALHEQDARHPGGYVAIDTSGKLYTVAMTPGVALVLSKGWIELINDEDDEAPPAPVEPPIVKTMAGRRR